MCNITNFTAYLIAKELRLLMGKYDPIKYLVCGGGRKNDYLSKYKNYFNKKYKFKFY
jgi:1,6-anhydro-N-acetylmuramate kinase